VQFAELFVTVLAVYGLAGIAFAGGFVIFGIHRLDPVAEQSSLGFRLIVIPGAAALWPLLLTRWLRAASRSR
jgi:hypothetical protein